MNRTLTIHDVPDEVHSALEAVGRERGQSADSVARQILVEGLGPAWRLERLQRYVTWDEAELAAFQEAWADQRRGAPADLEP